MRPVYCRKSSCCLEWAQFPVIFHMPPTKQQLNWSQIIPWKLQSIVFFQRWAVVKLILKRWVANCDARPSLVLQRQVIAERIWELIQDSAGHFMERVSFATFF